MSSLPKDKTLNDHSKPELSVAKDWLAGGGQIGELMRSIDWSKTPIGGVETWSPALRMMVRLLLANRFPLLLWWGPRYCQLYNDPCRPVLGKKHPRSMGQPASECFPEIWDIIGPLVDTPFNGGSATWMDDLQLEYIRYDRLEEAHFTVAYSPVPDETVPSGIGGVLATVHEITEQVVGERRGLVLRELGSQSGEAKTAEEACLIAARTLAQHPEDVPFALFYLLDGDRKKAHLAGAASIEMGQAESPLEIGLSGESSREAIWPLAETVRSEAMQIVEDLQGKLSSTPPGPWSDPPRSAAVWPIRSNMAHQFAGLLVLGLSSRLQFDDRYRDFCDLVTSQVATAIANASELVSELAAMNRLHQLSIRLLRETEFQPLLEEVLNATMALQDADFGNVQLYNPSTQALEIVAQRGFGQDFLDHFSSVNESSAACGRALQRGERVIIEDVLTDPDFEPHRAIAASGGYRAVQSTPLFNRGGKPLGMISTHFRQPHRPLERELRLTDLYALQAAELIERKHAEDALRASEERFRRYFDLGLIGMMTMTSPTKVILEINDELCHILGYERSELLQKTWAEMTHPDDLAADVAQFNRVMAGEVEGYSLDKRWIRKDGHVINSIMTAKCLRRADGSVDYFVGLVLDITERKRAEDRIRELGAIVESSDDAILGKTLDGIITSWNKGAEKIYGYAENEVIGQPISILVPVDRQDEAPQILGRLALGEAITHYETVRRRKDGQEIDVSLTISPIRNWECRIVGASAVARDITRRKQIEKALQQSEKRFTAFMANMPAFAWIKDTQGRYVYCNRMMEKLRLYSDGWFGKTDAEIWPPEIAAHYTSNDQMVIASGKALQTVEPYLLEGEQRYVLVSKFPIFDETGAVVMVGGASVEITERERAEKALRESEGRFRQLTENIGEVFWLADADLQSIIYVSPAYEIIWGRSCESLCVEPQTWLDAIHPEDRPRLLDARKARADVAYELEYRIVRPDGMVRWIRDRAFPVHDAADRVIRIAGVAEDITIRRHLEMQLRQSQKMEAIGQLAAGVAHNFNNLLSVISGHSELLGMLSPSDDRWHDSIAEIRRATELGSDSIRQLLVFSCQQILEPKVLDLNAVVAQAEKMLRRLIGEEVRLTTLLQPRTSPVRADLGQLNQVILNLAVNARDAMPQGGSLTIETRELDLDTNAHPEIRPGRYVLLTVADTGWGMAPDVQARIFEPFFTNKVEGKGTGLGLSVVFSIVQQSGGHIDVESRPGVGTKFKIYLPAVQETVEGPTQSASLEVIGGNETVLLVEDDEPVRNITTLLLGTLGYRVLGAANGQEALRLFNSREKIDLLMTDVVMPDLSGREVAEALRAQDPSLRVLFQSGYTDDTMVRWGVLHAEVAFLKKPFTLDVLARKVREVLDRP